MQRTAPVHASMHPPAPSVPSGTPPGRRAYLDWLRGLAVLIMIEAHVLDSWTRADQRASDLFAWSMVLGGLGAPLFLFLAGVSVALSAGSRTRRLGDAAAASRGVMRRGLQVFALAFLFRLQAMLVSWGTWQSLLKVDILNIMGPAIVAAAALWGAMGTMRGRLAAFAVATFALGMLTPPVRGAESLSVLPDPVEAYLRPRPGFTTFAIFPWAGFLFAGTFAGVWIENSRTAASERRVILGLALGGVALAAIAYAAAFAPSPFDNSQFWTSSPSFFFIRAGILVGSVAAAFAWSGRPARGRRWSPLEQMGRTSLFIYWIHIELIYGLAVRPLHKSLTLGEAWAGVCVFALLMLAASVLKERVAAALVRARPQPPKVVL